MRRNRLARIISTVTVMSLGLVTLIGLVSPSDSPAATIATFLIRVASVVAAVAVLIGIINLVMVHLGRFVRSEHGWPYSIVTLFAALAVGVVRILDEIDIWPDDMEGEKLSGRMFETVQVSLESALAALVLFFLVYAAYRLLRDRITPWNVLFVAVVIVVLLGWMPLENADALADVYDWLLRVPVSAGARGILIGIGLGTVTVGVRVLMGQDRSFRG